MAIKGEKIALYLSGQQVIVKECNIVISQPKVKDIVLQGEEKFLSAVQILGHSDRFLKEIKQGNPELSALEDFNIILSAADQDEDLRDNINTFLDLIFPMYNVFINNSAINFSLRNDENDKIIGQINPFTFPAFQEVILELFEPQSGDKKIEYNPVGDRAKAIAEKIKKGRARVEKQKAKSGEENQSLFGTYASVLSVGMNMDINIFFNYTPFQLYDTFIRYWKKVSSDFYQRVSTMPMMDTSKMEAPPD